MNRATHRRFRLASLAVCLPSSFSNLPSSARTTSWQDCRSITANPPSRSSSSPPPPLSSPLACASSRESGGSNDDDDRRRRGRRRLRPLNSSFGSGGGASGPPPPTAGLELLLLLRPSCGEKAGGAGGARSAEGGGIRYSRDAGEGSARLTRTLPRPWKKRHSSADCLIWYSPWQDRNTSVNPSIHRAAEDTERIGREGRGGEGCRMPHPALG